jgi:hypothetical protein
MSKRHSIWALVVLALALSAAWGQDSSAPQSSGTAPDATPQQPTPAFGQDSPATPVAENPPISGLDLPGLEPHAAPLSYLQPGATVSESADSNVEGGLGGSSFRSITRGLGSLTLQRVWSNYDLAINYIGGVGYYNVHGLGWKLLQQMDLAQKITWKRGQLTIRDNFGYLPEGNFGDAYGSFSSRNNPGTGLGSFSGFYGGSSFGALGQVPRLTNLSLAEVSQNLTPKSSVTATGGYAITHFYGTDITGRPYLNSSQISAQVGYNRILTPHDQMALVYGYQEFDFSTLGSAFHSHVMQVMYGHRISGRMDFLIGAGPQITQIGVACTPQDLQNGTPPCTVDLSGNIIGTRRDTRLGVAGRAQVRYRFAKTMLQMSYDRYVTSGSGIFLGAQSDVARLQVSRPITRVWSGFADIGFARNAREQPVTPQQLTPQQLLLCTPSATNPTPPPCPGVAANTYIYGFAGAGVHRQIGHEWNVFGSYQFNELAFDSSFCTGQGFASCSRISQRHVITLGLDWTPRPIRID